VNVLGLFNAGRYADLDTLAQQLQQQRSRFEGGAWRLHVLFGTLSSPGSATATDAAWKAQIAKLEQWAQSSPASPTPRIALAQTYLRFAWKARGHGYANTVTPEGWALFQGRVQSARSTLEQSAALAENSPHWYLEMQGVALDQQWDRAAFDALAERALAHEPGYYYFATSESNYLLPKWYGKSGDTERYAAQVADRIGGDEGDAVYFQIAAAINCCKRTQAPALSWRRRRHCAATVCAHRQRLERIGVENQGGLRRRSHGQSGRKQQSGADFRYQRRYRHTRSIVISRRRSGSGVTKVAGSQSSTLLCARRRLPVLNVGGQRIPLDS
jgi:hypothetical protein